MTELFDCTLSENHFYRLYNAVRFLYLEYETEHLSRQDFDTMRELYRSIARRMLARNERCAPVMDLLKSLNTPRHNDFRTLCDWENTRKQIGETTIRNGLLYGLMPQLEAEHIESGSELSEEGGEKA